MYVFQQCYFALLLLAAMSYARSGLVDSSTLRSRINAGVPPFGLSFGRLPSLEQTVEVAAPDVAPPQFAAAQQVQPHLMPISDVLSPASENATDWNRAENDTVYNSSMANNASSPVELTMNGFPNDTLEDMGNNSSALFVMGNQSLSNDSAVDAISLAAQKPPAAAERKLHSCVNMQFSLNETFGLHNQLTDEEVAELNLPYAVNVIYTACPEQNYEEYFCMPEELGCLISPCDPVATGWCVPDHVGQRIKRHVLGA